MGTLTLFMHISLDGFAARLDGQMDWIHVDDEIFDYGAERIYATEIAVYGRKTFQMMEDYWPTAADQPNATKHDIDDKMVQKSEESCLIENPERSRLGQHEGHKRKFI